MKRIVLPMSYGTRTELLLYASRLIRLVAVPCRALAVCFSWLGRFFERLPESLARFALHIMEPANAKRP